ncbi:G-type lectin S-receptor-like serine/threonine-protein kinase At4g27290 [Ziziphus jujuba]|uniref:G-type lectin S-receptor-like serine/threonine-protein kinase At4g27290 n=1 Tax=Ziziphus jujuba TaxID=326968 RepID=A0ABM3ZZM6_ZIZJJ|nr:G-type lectin S-receptor-like serine/threonine-protein kinase At4g27290 [Ziziphus jujuba]
MEDLNRVSSVQVIPHTEQAILSISDNKSSVFWSAGPTKSVQAPILKPLDTRDLELRNEKYDNSENHLWQRFDYPCDTLLPGSEKYYRTGPWNGLGYSGAPELKPNPLFNFEFVSNKDEVYYNFYLKNEFAKSRVVVDQTNGYTRNRYGCNSGTQSWEGFKPKGNFMDWSEGFARNKSLNCLHKDSVGFVKFQGLKLPDTTHSWVNEMGGGSGCFKWFGDLNDIREFQDGGQDLCVRMHALELVVCCADIKCEGANGEGKVKIALEVLAVIFLICGMLLLAHYIRNFRAKKCLEDNVGTCSRIKNQNNEGQTENLELLFFDLDKISEATSNISSNNKIGKGNFGPAYKGTLEDGQEIDVKKLARSS